MLTKKISIEETTTKHVELKKNDLIIVRGPLSFLGNRMEFGEFRVLSYTDGLLICTHKHVEGTPKRISEVVPFFVDGIEITIGYNSDTHTVELFTNRNNKEVSITVDNGTLGYSATEHTTVVNHVGVETYDTVRDMRNGKDYQVVDVSAKDMVLRNEETGFIIEPLKHADQNYAIIRS